MAQHLRPVAEASRATKARSAAATARRLDQPTIEDRLDAKAAKADHADYSARRSLGQMTDDEIRKRLFHR